MLVHIMERIPSSFNGSAARAGCMLRSAREGECHPDKGVCKVVRARSMPRRPGTSLLSLEQILLLDR
jgi:hypothetical protein